ncbi:SDR family oxidoreductase [Microbacterium sp. STN6]|uniref:SDR family oxidoreductase n=1 Tax=Microbacterium sp. STN6 TaxID=2995588 RepID=UPI002260F332|nr:SDR family oxidoreductase [Microbacterium sp. STN6]MCX7523463.1 SDR family oxidoreductase [Microbacterium sp. STN6]
MSLVITGATGKLGHLVIDSLLRRGVDAGDIVATGRRVDVLAELEKTGVRTVAVDHDRPDTLEGAFAGADALLLISGSEVGKRTAQHRNVIDAAVAAGVGRIIYTSAPRADTSTLVLAPEHAATEIMIRESGLPFTMLRNNWYTENYVVTLEQARGTGEVVASTGAGRVASATRADYADAAAAALVDDDTTGRIYELSGDVAWDFEELAATIGRIIGVPVVYRALSPEEHREYLLAAGLDEGTASFVVTLDGDIRGGALAEVTSDLRTLIGRPTTPLEQGLRDALGD